MTKRVGMKARFTVGLGGQLSLLDSKKCDVFLPGHSLDTLTGGRLNRYILRARIKSHASQHLINMHGLLVLEEMGAELIPEHWSVENREELILGNWQFSSDDPFGSIDRWNFENRQRRLILSELRTYEEFGRWMLPFYDYDLFDFFERVPLELRYQQRLLIDTLVYNIFIDDLLPLAQIPIANKGLLQSIAPSWQDWLLIKMPATVIDNLILKRYVQSKHNEHLASIGARSPIPSGPDPLDYWWYDDSSFRSSFIKLFQHWDGLHGLIDVSALLNMLQKPLPSLFIQFSLPAILTLCYFQQAVVSQSKP